MDYFLSREKEVFIEGGCGKIQAGLMVGENAEVCVLVCHPHPQYQGTMFNKVVTTVVKAATKKNLSCLRFNYRGVGKSQGSYAGGIGEEQDALVAGKWLLKKSGCQKLFLIGFSFGGGIAYRAQRELPCQGVLLICPSIKSQNDHQPLGCPLWVLQAQEDEVIDCRKVSAWSKSVGVTEMIMIEGASHFFHGKLLELQSELERLL
ncbi:MAG: alpha/beta hydrolase [Pseudomonadota bacterium]|nr:alpha/beta hydrolase [Pseudomonadota bacterium]